MPSGPSITDSSASRAKRGIGLFGVFKMGCAGMFSLGVGLFAALSLLASYVEWRDGEPLSDVVGASVFAARCRTKGVR